MNENGASIPEFIQMSLSNCMPPRIRLWLLFCALAASAGPATASPQHVRERVRIEPLHTLPGSEGDASDLKSPAVLCDGTRHWCLQIRRDEEPADDVLQLFDMNASAERRSVGRFQLTGNGDQESFEVWPHLVRMRRGPAAGEDTPEVVLIGVVTHMSTMYSGGGATAAHLQLIKVELAFGHARLREVLTVPFKGSALIRACFSEADMEARAGACHDDYSFSASLTLRASNAAPGAMPEFDFKTQATRFPGLASRNADSLGNPPLKQKDLVTVTDKACSYTRVLRFNPATERYEFNVPAPDCSEFTAP